MKLNVIKNSIISEKAYQNMDKGIYTFQIANGASKQDVVAAVKKFFAVDAVKVNITAIPSKSKRIGKTRKFVTIGGGKKAIVKLKAGQSINILSTKTEAKKSEKKENKKKEDKK